MGHGTHFLQNKENHGTIVK